MIYEHQQNAINYITNKLRTDNQVDALLISGSISHGFNDENSDVDINIIVSDEIYAQKTEIIPLPTGKAQGISMRAATLTANI